MRKVLMMLLCCISIVASATDYYVSSTGNDSSTGLSSSTPWKSISKVNSEFANLNAGDRILFKRGETFYGSLSISRSGSAGSPVTISAYGSGNNPVITGFTTISGWVNYGGGIYYKSVSCESDPNMVTVNGVNTPMGRWPNSGYMSIDSHSSNTSIYDAQLSSSPDWTGAEIVIRKNLYIWDRNAISSHSGSTIYYTSGSYYSAIDGYGYFIQKSLSTLDQPGEWYYDGNNFYMYFGSAGPSNYAVKVSTIDEIAYLDDKNYITFDNLTIEGANVNAIQVRNSDYITIQNCNINFTGGTAIYGPWWGTSPYCKITSNTITNSNSNAISFQGDHTYATVTSNTIRKSGVIVGMGGSGDGTYNAVNVLGANSLIQYNTIEETGYIGIHFAGSNTVVSNNFVNGFNLVKDDGGGIYTYVGTGTACSGQKVTNNIVINGMGYPEATPGDDIQAVGIYLDDRTENVLLQNNTLANCNSAGIYLHNAHEIGITGNTLYNNGNGRDDWGTQMLCIHDGYSPDDPIRNVTMNNNIFFAREASQYAWCFVTPDNDISSFGTSDNNAYAKPVDNSRVVRTWSAGWSGSAIARSLDGWQSFSGQDNNSYESPVSFTDLNRIRFEYNASNSNKVVSLDGSYIDVKGDTYSGSITLAPYSSVVLMVASGSTTPVVTAPVYVSSAISNAAPDKIEMTYNMSLANIVPSSSAFTVLVNSNSRGVNAVAVSGTKVTLTLSYAVVAGDVITVSYTKPSSNPLQTTAGGQAATLAAKTVTNNVLSSGNEPPVVTSPVYSGALIANATPDKLEMTYNMSLASIVPSSSAFTVLVNSNSRGVNAVAVSGTKVTLTLSYAVVAGDVITVSYTKPSSNPLQTTAGGQAATLAAQTVKNNVGSVSNDAPVAVVKYDTKSYSGFVGEISAGESYDANKDNLTFSWNVPSNIAVSSTTGPAIQFLSPIVNESETVEFTLKINDGKTTTTKTISFEVVPFQPGLDVAEVVDIEASGYEAPHYPYNMIDGNIGTMWSVNGVNQWVIMELKDPISVKHVKMAFQPGINRVSYFDILGSEDKINWEPVLNKEASCAFSSDIQVFEFPASKAEKEYKYIKLVGESNAVDTWNSISEFKIFGYKHKYPTSYEEQPVKIYPNPASEYFNVKIEDSEFSHDFIRILTVTGMVMYTENVDPEVTEFRVPIDLKKGVYLVQIGSGDITSFSQKLIVAR